MTCPGVFVSESAAATRAHGEALAAQLAPGQVVALFGDLGSGKTCLVQGICAGLGVVDPVTSPTFILINEYAGRAMGRPVPVYHFDLYRLGSPAELEDLGAEEYFYGAGICLVEWAEHAGNLLPPNRWEVRFTVAGADRRQIHTDFLTT